MPDAAVPAPAAPRRRRWPRVLLVVALLLVLLLAVAPSLAAPWVAGLVVEQANASVNGSARLGDLSFGWGGGVRAADVSLADRDGAPVLTLRELDAEVDLLGALSGRYQARVRLAGLRADLRRGAAGELNVATLPRPAATPPGAGPAPPAPEAGGAPGLPVELPDLRLDLELTDGEIVVHDGDRATTLGDLRLALRLDGLDRPAPFELSARVSGPDGPGGALSLAGELTVAEGGRLDAAGLRARCDLSLQDVLLAALQPAAAALAGLSELRGTLSGSGHWTFSGPLALDGRTELRLAGLRAAGGPLPQPLELPDVRLLLQAGLDAQGSGTQQLDLSAGDALALRWDGRARGLLQAEGALDGELSLTARLGPLQSLLAGALPLRAGLALDGGARLVLQPALVLHDGAPAGGQLALRAGLEGLSARDAQGRALDLAELRDVDLALRAGFDAAAGALRLDELRLSAGPLEASGRGGVTGLPRDGATFDLQALSVQDGELSASADLDRLAALAGRVIDLGDLAPGGRVTLAATLAGGGRRIETGASVDVAGLRIGAGELAGLPPLDLRLRQRGTLDLAPGGTSELAELSLETSFLELRASGTLRDVADAQLRAGRLQPALRVRIGQAAAALGPLLGALRPSGEDLLLTGTLDLRGAALDAALALDAPRLELADAGGGPPLRLAGLRLDVEAALPGAQRAEVRRLALGLSGGQAAGGELPPLALSTQASLDGDAGTLELRDLLLTAPGLELRATASARGLPAAGDGAAAATPPAGELQATLVLQPAELQARLGALPGGLALAGEPLTAHVTAGTRDGVHVAQAQVRAARLDLTLPAAGDGAPRPLSQRDLVLDLDASADLRPGAGRLEVRSARLSSSTAAASLSGTLTGLDRPGAEAADLTLELQAALERALQDLAGVLPPGLPQASGALTLRGALTGDQGRLSLQADTTVRDLVATLPGEPPLQVRDPELRLGLSADVETATLDVHLRRGELASTLASGTFGGRLAGLAGDAPRAEGLHAELRWVPDRVAALLGGLLPVGLSGAQEETLTLQASGPLAGGDLRAALAGLDLQARLGTGTFALPGLALDGEASVTARDGSLRLGGDFATGGGRITLDGALDLRRAGADVAPRSTLAASFSRVRAAGGLSSALAAINPLFASATGGGGEASATLDAGLELAFDGELPLEALLAGAAPPLEPLSGTGTLGLAEVTLAGSPLVSDLLARLGRSASAQTSLEPVALALRGGRVHYQQPWAVALGGTPTTLSGSVGLDGTLDLSWNVPVTAELAGKHAFLQRLQGQDIAIPLRGTLSGPKLAWDSALGDLAQKAAEQELKDRLGGLLGGAGAGGAAAGGQGGGEAGGAAASNDPAELLKQADALWDAGKKDEARPIYKRIKDDFKLTTTYLFNRDRIDDRSKSPKKPKGSGSALAPDRGPGGVVEGAGLGDGPRQVKCARVAGPGGRHGGGRLTHR